MESDHSHTASACCSRKPLTFTAYMEIGQRRARTETFNSQPGWNEHMSGLHKIARNCFIILEGARANTGLCVDVSSGVLI